MFFDYYPTILRLSSTHYSMIIQFVSMIIPLLSHGLVSFINLLSHEFSFIAFFAVYMLGLFGWRCCSWWPTLCLHLVPVPRLRLRAFDPLRSGWFWWPWHRRDGVPYGFGLFLTLRSEVFEFGIVADPTGAWQRNKDQCSGWGTMDIELRSHNRPLDRKFWRWSGCPFLVPTDKTFCWLYNSASPIWAQWTSVVEPFSFLTSDDFSAWSIEYTWWFFHYNPLSHQFFMTILLLALVIPLLFKCYSINIPLLCQSCSPCYAHIHISLLIFCTYVCRPFSTCFFGGINRRGI